MEEFEFSIRILSYVLASALAAAFATLPNSDAIRGAGIFIAVMMGFLAFMFAGEEAIMWFALR